MSPGSGKQEAKELQCIGIDVGPSGCVMDNENPGKQPSLSGEIDGRTTTPPSPVVPGKDLPGVKPKPSGILLHAQEKGKKAGGSLVRRLEARDQREETSKADTKRPNGGESFPLSSGCCVCSELSDTHIEFF